MDLEKLTTHQIVLLTLLVSFVTSIATGIVTVTLVDQAPPAVTNTVNRVIERTVERVVADESNQAASVITKETTVIVKEEDLITDAIQSGSQSLVRIETTSVSEEDKILYKTIALGTILSETGLVVTDSSVIEEEGEYLARISGERFPLRVLSIDDEIHAALLQIVLSEEERTFIPVSFVDQKDLKLGQTVISLGGAGRNTVFMGVISALVDGISEGDGENDEHVLQQISTTVLGDRITGSPNFNVFGELLGVGVYSPKESFVVPSGRVLSMIQAYKNSQIASQ